MVLPLRQALAAVLVQRCRGCWYGPAATAQDRNRRLPPARSCLLGSQLRIPVARNVCSWSDDRQLTANTCQTIAKIVFCGPDVRPKQSAFAPSAGETILVSQRRRHNNLRQACSAACSPSSENTTDFVRLTGSRIRPFWNGADSSAGSFFPRLPQLIRPLNQNQRYRFPLAALARIELHADGRCVGYLHCKHSRLAHSRKVCPARHTRKFLVATPRRAFRNHRP